MNRQNDTQVSVPHYDPHLIPAETAARQQREGKDFGHTPMTKLIVTTQPMVTPWTMKGYSITMRSSQRCTSMCLEICASKLHSKQQNAFTSCKSYLKMRKVN